MTRETGQARSDAEIVRSSWRPGSAGSPSKRATAMRTLWQQVDDAAISDPIEQARFLLGRLYPEMPRTWFESTIAALAARHAQGRWHGYRQP